ncbi:MAG: hypothetical protein ACR2RF_09945 [Geminicoccaceae bacterium]
MSVENISLIRGESFTWTGVLRDRNGVRIDLTSLTLTWKAGEKDFLRAEIELSEGNGITVTDAVRGEWQIDIRTADTKEQTEGLYRHQGFATDGNTVNRLFTRGRLDIRGDIRT